MTQPVEYEQVTYNSPGGAQIGKSSTELVAFYGAVPVVQRPYSSAVHATSALVTSAGSLFVASHLAALQEIQLTLIGLGIWATV